MKHILIFAAILFVSCTKEIEPRPVCGNLTFTATTYGDNWEVLEVLTTDFGEVCGDELEYYKGVIGTQPGRGVMICPPVKQFGKWIIKP